MGLHLLESRHLYFKRVLQNLENTYFKILILVDLTKSLRNLSLLKFCLYLRISPSLINSAPLDVRNIMTLIRFYFKELVKHLWLVTSAICLLTNR